MERPCVSPDNEHRMMPRCRQSRSMEVSAPRSYDTMHGPMEPSCRLVCMNESPILGRVLAAPNVAFWVQSAAGAYASRLSLRGLGVGSSAAVTRNNALSHSASSHRSAAMSICGLAPGYGGASDTGSAWARPDTVGAGRLFKQKFDRALLRCHGWNLTDERCRAQRSHDSLRCRR